MLFLTALLAAAPLALEKGPVVSDVTATEVEIRWEPPVEGAVLVIGTGDAAGVAVPTETHEGVQRARARGLRPDTLHRFRVRAAGQDGAEGTFRTFPDSADAPIAFIAFGDTRTQHSVHARIAERLAAEDPDFVVSTGDLVGDGRDPADWEIFFRTAGAMLRETPFFPAVGNHDARGVLNETMLDRWFGRARYYEVPVGPVILLFADTTLAYGGGSRQRAWLERRLTAARAAVDAGKASWIVMVHHHPAFSSARHGSDASVQRELVPLYERHGVHLVLNGHDHVYERLERNGITYLVTGGGGAPLYAFDEPLPESQVRVRSHHYVRIAADRDRLELTAVDLDGNVLDRHTLRADAVRRAPPKKAASGRALPLTASFAVVAAAGAMAWVMSGRIVRR